MIGMLGTTIGGFLGTLFKPNQPQYQPQQDTTDNSATYLAVGVMLVLIVVMVLIFKSKK